MARPTILIIGGSFSPSHFYNQLVEDLASHGFTAEVRDLPSADRRPPSPAATLADDATYFSYIINRLCAEGQDVIVLGHSYGGSVVTDAIKGLTEKQEGRGRVVGTIYLTALMPKVGQSLTSMFEGQGSLDFLKIEGEYMYHSPLDLSAKTNFSDIPLEQGIKVVEQLRWHSGAALAGTCTHAGYEDVHHCAFVLCTKDMTISPEFQRKMINEADEGRRAKGRDKIRVYKLEAGHVPTVSKPRELAEVVAKAAGDML